MKNKTTLTALAAIIVSAMVRRQFRAATRRRKTHTLTTTFHKGLRSNKWRQKEKMR